MAEEFNVAEFLTTTEFTIPVVVSEKKGLNKTIQVTYKFDDEIAEQCKPKKPKLNSNGNSAANIETLEDALQRIAELEAKPDADSSVSQVMISLNQQLALMVKKINGIETPIDAEFWSRTRLRYRRTILNAILEDVYPNPKA